MELSGNWNYPTAIRFGAHRAKELPEMCAELSLGYPMIVTDPGLAKLPLIAKLGGYLTDAGLAYQLFSDMQLNPVGRDVDAGVAMYHRGGHDGIIAIGGGSALDVGKAIALMSGQHRPLFDFEDAGDNVKRVNIAGIAPCIAVPTTAGTGSEVGRASVIINEKSHRKVIIFHPKMLPALVLADPELTIGLPSKLTAATGMDALAHNLEAYCSPAYHPMAQGVALEGMRLVHDYLYLAYQEGANLEARSHMLAASIMGAMAFQKGLGGVHALAHPIGALFNGHHGLINAILLPYVLERNMKTVADKLTAAARYMDLAKADAVGFLQWILDLRAAMAIPHSLAAVGVTVNDIERIAYMAKDDPSGSGNPVVFGISDYASILQDALNG